MNMLSVHYKDASWTFVAVINMELCPIQKGQGQFLLPAGRSTLLVWKDATSGSPVKDKQTSGTVPSALPVNIFLQPCVFKHLSHFLLRSLEVRADKSEDSFSLSMV